MMQDRGEREVQGIEGVPMRRRAGANERQEGALFCVSGTMTNQLALRSVMHPMESVLVDNRSHLYLYEVGGVAYHRCVWMTRRHWAPRTVVSVL